MAQMNAATDLGISGLGDQLSQQLQSELAKRRKKASQAMTNPIQGAAAMSLLGAPSS